MTHTKCIIPLRQRMIDDMRSYMGIDPYNKPIDRNSDNIVEQANEVIVQFRR